MSKAKFAAAKELIDSKQYAEARAVLKTIDHPTAREWELKLDKIAPQPRVQNVSVFQSPAEPARKPSGCLRRIIFAIVAAIVVVFFLNLVSRGPSPQVSSPGPTEVVQAVATRQPPTSEPVGMRSNPYQEGIGGSIRDGRFQVNQMERNMTAAVERMNQFNSDPDPGEEWVIINVTFFCDLPSDQTCNVSQMDLEVVGSMGNVYDRELFAVIDNDFSGEVFGGGSKSGDVGFIVKIADDNLLLVVNDLGDRVFFSTGD